MKFYFSTRLKAIFITLAILLYMTGVILAAIYLASNEGWQFGIAAIGIFGPLLAWLLYETVYSMIE